NLYADGGFSAAPGLGAPGDQKDPAHFGPIADGYTKSLRSTVIAVEGPLYRRWSFEGGFDKNTVGYGAPAPIIPPDAGRQGNIFAAVKYGEQAGPGLGLGTLLGFGLAGRGEWAKPLRRPFWSSSGEFRAAEAGRATSSGKGYGEFLARAQTSYTYGHN